MFNRLDEARRRKRARDKGDAYRLKTLRWKRFCRIAGPKAVPVSGHGHETGYAGVADTIVDVSAFDIGSAQIPSTEPGIAGSRPGLGQSRREVLRVHAPIQRAPGRSPNLPGCVRFQKPVLEPVSLPSAKQGVGWPVFSEIDDLGIADADRVGWIAMVGGPAGIDDSQRLFRIKIRELRRKQPGCFGTAGLLFHPIAVLIGNDE